MLNSRRRHNGGFMLVEVLVVIVLFAITGLATTLSTVLLFDSLGRTDQNSLASQIALEELERLAAIDPSLLSSANNTSEVVVRDEKNFIREVEITVNADGSRAIEVGVTDENSRFPTSVSVSNIFALWGSL